MRTFLSALSAFVLTELLFFALISQVSAQLLEQNLLEVNDDTTAAQEINSAIC